jgi:hypothetical protein
LHKYLEIAHYDAGLTKQVIKSIRSLEKRIAGHEAKLAEFIKNPDAFDNKGFLKNAPTNEARQRIIDGRVKHLKGEIEAFKNKIEQLIGGS